MRFRVTLPTRLEGPVLPIPFARPGDFGRRGRVCERWGYDGAWGNDHITTQEPVRCLHAKPPHFYEGFMTPATVGAHPTRLRLGTFLIVIPMRDAVRLATQAATLDRFTGGRFILGIGLGACREEFEAWAPRRRHARRGEMVERAARYGRGWLPGWRRLDEIRERVARLKSRAGDLSRDPGAIEIAPRFSVIVGQIGEGAEARYLRGSLVAHRRSLATTGRDLRRQVEANPVGSPDLIIEKLGQLRDAGVDHCCALRFPVDSVQEMLDRMQWFAEAVMPSFP